MNRTIVPLVCLLAGLAVFGAMSGCSVDSGNAFDTLPPIRSTTTSTSSTLPEDQRIRVYTVKEGENLSMIAGAFGVPVEFIIRHNTATLGDPNNVQPGTVLEIPPYQYFEELPDPPPSTASGP